MKAAGLKKNTSGCFWEMIHRKTTFIALGLTFGGLWLTAGGMKEMELIFV
jgi:hypothetical protein